MCCYAVFTSFSGWGTIGDGFQYKIGNTPLDFVECHRDLGVLIVRELKFPSHIKRCFSLNDQIVT